MSSRPRKPIVIETFVECLVQAMHDYKIDKEGFAQKDLFPTAALLAGHLLKESAATGHTTICMAHMKKDNNRKWVARQLEKMGFEIEPYECLLDIYCCTAMQPYQTLLTIECEGACGQGKELTSKSTPEDSEILWDLFKLLQVPSPIRIFMNLCTEKNRRIDLLERKIDSMVNMYRKTPRAANETFSIVFPAGRLEGKEVNVYRWIASRSKPDMVPITQSMWRKPRR